MLIMKAAILLLALLVGIFANPEREGLKEKLGFKRFHIDPVKFPRGAIIPRILGGKEAVPHSIPYQVYLSFQKGYLKLFCGGSLISQNYVLTAGHCTAGATHVNVYLGAHITEKSQLHVDSSDITTHEKFNPSSRPNDIGVIKLPKPVTLNDNIKVIELPSRDDANLDLTGAEARVSGWGLTQDPDFGLSPVLMEVNSTVISNDECKRFLDNIEEIHVCISGKEGHSACHGDSGGPLVVGNKQMGIVSFGNDSCAYGYPSAFTRITSYLDWLEANTDVKIV